MADVVTLPRRPFNDPDPFQEITFPNRLAAKRAIADWLMKPLAKLTPARLAGIDAILEATLVKETVMDQVKRLLQPTDGTGDAMQTEVMQHYGFAKDFKQAGYFEAEHHQAVSKEIKAAIQVGRIISLSGIVGCGKTKALQRLQQELINEKQVLVSRSFSIEKAHVNISTLTTAMFLDLVKDKDFKIPGDRERRDRTLRDVICSRRRPVVLIIDEAHDLHTQTLVQLKRLVELVEVSGGILSVVLAGHPKLKNELSRAAMEQIGSRTTRIQKASKAISKPTSNGCWRNAGNPRSN